MPISATLPPELSSAEDACVWVSAKRWNDPAKSECNDIDVAIVLFAVLLIAAAARAAAVSRPAYLADWFEWLRTRLNMEVGNDRALSFLVRQHPDRSDTLLAEISSHPTEGEKYAVPPAHITYPMFRTVWELLDLMTAGEGVLVARPVLDAVVKAPCSSGFGWIAARGEGSIVAAWQEATGAA